MATLMAEVPTLSLREESRLAALYSLALPEHGVDAEFEALVALAADMLDCPTALVTLVDRDRQWIKAGINPAFSETPRALSICDHTIRERDTFVVPDTLADPRFHENSLIHEHSIRFYAGLPIHAVDSDGERHPIGTICVIDSAPRLLDPAAERTLRKLATLADALISARQATFAAQQLAHEHARQAADLARQERVLLQAERMAMIGSWRLTLADSRVEWSDNVYRIHGLPVEGPPSLDRALDFYPPPDRARVAAALARLIERHEPVDIETDFIAADGVRKRVRSIGELELVDGRPHALIGIFQDVTERHALEQTLRRTAESDELTGIANRTAFNRALAAAMDEATSERTPLLLALIDLDGFKAINDTLGHVAGDDVLRAIGRRLEQPWLLRSCAARIGGDEFALIVTDPALVDDPAAFAQRLESSLCLPTTVEGLTIAAAGTVGIALLDADGDTPRSLMKRADVALYAAKRGRVGDRHRGG